MKLSDFKGLFKKSITTIEKIENPFEDYYTIQLKPSNGFQWSPGEHAIFKLPESKIDGKKWRAFSIASITEEGFILIGIRTGENISSFKKALISSSIGTKVKMTGPFGWFKLQDNISPIVMVAGGVGITPIRGLAKKLENNTSRDITILYASNGNYLFGDELEKIADKNSKIKLIKTTNAGMTTEELNKLAALYGQKAWYYLSGSQNFIKGMKDIITNTGITEKRVINDPFIGY